MSVDCPAPTPPSLAGFLAFVRRQMGVEVVNLPDDDPSLQLSFCVAEQIVNEQLRWASPLIYQQAVYNLAGSNLINFAQDQEGSTYFADLRKNWNILGFVSGVVSSASDESTSMSIEVFEAAKGMTLANLQQAKDPFGRAYLGLAQSVGTLWGMS